MKVRHNRITVNRDGPWWSVTLLAGYGESGEQPRWKPLQGFIRNRLLLSLRVYRRGLIAVAQVRL